MTEQKSGRWGHIPPDSAELPSDLLDFLLPTVTLRCLNVESAQQVINEFPNRHRGGQSNTMKVDADSVVITYADKRWPYDIADWAERQGLASGHDSGRVFTCL